jgi:hypothetical protein
MPFASEGGHGHDVGWHMWLVWILQLKIFGRHFIIFALPKWFCKASNGTSNAKKNHSNQWKNEQDIFFPSEGVHMHDVGWHIWPIWILELKIFECHSIVFALQKGFVNLQMALL